jgi:lipopolysaccharide export LptBFGC system permease protein LptF
MTLLIVLLLGFALGTSVPRRSMTIVPVIAGAILIMLLSASGRDITDTPIPFVVVIATAAIAGGMLRRSRARPRPTR